MPNDPKKPVLAIATGGTGGHFYPALAIAQAALDLGAFEPVLIVGGHNLDRHLELASAHGIRALPVPAPRQPASRLALPLFALRLALAVCHARGIQRKLRPQAVLGMGSFASVPFCLACATTRIPLCLHEGNAVLGRANRWLARFANKLLLSLPLETPTPKCPTFQTGFPVRPALLAATRSDNPQATSKAQTRVDFGFAPEHPVLLVFGGSQGATFINTVLPETLRETWPSVPHLQVLHLAGSHQEAQRLTTVYDALDISHRVLAHTENMAACYHAADVVLARAGGATVAELAMFKKPAILIPFPAATDDHQTANAQALARHNAAIHLPQTDITPRNLAETIAAILQSPENQMTLTTQIAKFAHPNAPLEIVNHLIP